SDVAAQLAVHFDRGGDHIRAVRHLREAANVALRRSAYEEAAFHLGRAIELLDALPESPETVESGLAARALLLRVGWLAGLGGEKEAPILAEARDLARRADDPRALAQLLLDYGASRAFDGDVAEHRAAVAEASRVDGAGSDRALRVAELLGYGTAHTW